MLLTIETYEGIGPIKFGISRDEVRNILGSTVRSFKKTPDSEMPTDAFDDLGIYVYYKKPGLVEAVEFAPPASPLFEGKQLLKIPFNELQKWFEKIDPAIEVDDSGLTSNKYGIGLYAPSAKEQPSSLAESVIVFEKGYYD